MTSSTKLVSNLFKQIPMVITYIYIYIYIDPLDSAIWDDSILPSKTKQQKLDMKSYVISFATRLLMFPMASIQKKVPPPLPRAIQPSELRWKILHTHGLATEAKELRGWKIPCCLGCDLGGAKERSGWSWVIYFPTNLRAKEPQNLPNHRVYIV